MGTNAVISSKGQLVIPARLRRRYGLEEGTTVTFHEEGGRLLLEPTGFSALYTLQGAYSGFPLEAELDAERRKSRKRENER